MSYMSPLMSEGRLYRALIQKFGQLRVNDDPRPQQPDRGDSEITRADEQSPNGPHQGTDADQRKRRAYNEHEWPDPVRDWIRLRQGPAAQTSHHRQRRDQGPPQPQPGRAFQL